MSWVTSSNSELIDIQKGFVYIHFLFQIWKDKIQPSSNSEHWLIL